MPRFHYLAAYPIIEEEVEINVYPIVDEEAHGIMAYAVSEGIAKEIVDALIAHNSAPDPLDREAVLLSEFTRSQAEPTVYAADDPSASWNNPK